jgi:LacI family sucrose operon transcriptional repressor
LQGVLGVCVCYASAAISIITANESEGMDMSSGKITMDDIANMAGVTKSTVSRYFNGGSVRESTRERIQEIIREYNYEPNTFARLKAKESNVIGVVLPTLNSKVSVW